MKLLCAQLFLMVWMILRDPPFLLCFVAAAALGVGVALLEEDE